MKDIIKDPVITTPPETISPEPEAKPEAKPEIVPEVTQEISAAEVKPETPTIDNEPAPTTSEEKLPAEESSPVNEIAETEPLSFEEHWVKVADLFFNKMPTVYYSIREHIPEIKDHIVLVSIKNSLQKDLIESKKKEVIAYLRTHFNEEIQDLEVLVDELLVSKIKLLDAREKVMELAQENEELTEFLKILNLSVKE